MFQSKQAFGGWMRPLHVSHSCETLEDTTTYITRNVKQWIHFCTIKSCKCRESNNVATLFGSHCCAAHLYNLYGN